MFSKVQVDTEALWLIESSINLSTDTPSFILTLLASIQSADNMFHSFNVLCENKNFPIFSLQCSFAIVASCPLE